MTRVSTFAVLCFAAMTMAVTNVNAQCASCGQTGPSFAQAAATPAASFVAAPSYAAPVYAQPQVAYSAAPISSGCSSCAQSTYTSFPAPAPIYQDAGCGCGAPVAQNCGCAQPVASCGCEAAPTCCESPQRFTRVRLLRRSRSNNCCCY